MFQFPVYNSRCKAEKRHNRGRLGFTAGGPTKFRIRTVRQINTILKGVSILSEQEENFS